MIKEADLAVKCEFMILFKLFINGNLVIKPNATMLIVSIIT